MPSPPPWSPQAAARWAPAAALLLHLALRLPGLTALPIFLDESFYLHQAQMVRLDPLGNAFISVNDPKPPLHIWLLALALSVVADPLEAGRLLSVAVGALTILAIFPLCRLLAHLPRAPTNERDQEERGYGAISALFIATCPYLAFYDRLAVPDGLMVLAGVVVAWLSLRLAKSTWEPVDSGRPFGKGLLLGGALGLAMLTRQYFSYVLWLLPPLAFLLWPRRASFRAALLRYVPAQLAALGVALILWAPFLLAKSGMGVWMRILYHDRYLRGGMGGAERVRTAASNAARIFLPFEAAADGRWRFGLDVGWFWTYLTPPMAILCVSGVLWLLRREERRLGVYFAGWFLVTCAPLVVFATVLFPRYGVPAVIPLLLAGARVSWIGIWRTRRAERPRLRRTALLAGGLALVVAWPVASVIEQSAEWRRQPFVAIDRSQFISGWPAGSAVRESIAFLRGLSRRGPIAVANVVSDKFPNLAVSVAFANDPLVRVYHSDWTALVPSVESWPSPRQVFAQGSDYRPSRPFEPVVIPAGTDLVVVRPEPLVLAGRPVSERDIAAWGRLQLVRRFANPRGAESGEAAAIRIERIAPDSQQ